MREKSKQNMLHIQKIKLVRVELSKICASFKSN